MRLEISNWESANTEAPLDNFYLGRPDAAEFQMDLFRDYKGNVALYPTFQKYFRTYKPPFLAVWGKNDPFFLPHGAEAFQRDMPDALVRFFDTGPFALETTLRRLRQPSGTCLPNSRSLTVDEPALAGPGRWP